MRAPTVGIAFLPEVGSGVWIEFEGGDVSYPIWVGCYWREGELPSSVEADGEGDPRRRASRRSSSTTSTTRSPLTDWNGNSVNLEDKRILIKRQQGTIVISNRRVKVNDAAMEVT